MGRLVLILGGARSGKSSMAERMAGQMGGRVTYLATAQPLDDEMRLRIEKHKADRPAAWRTLEEPLNLAGGVHEALGCSDVVIVDCLTLWISNHLCLIQEAGQSPGWHAAVEELAERLRRQAALLVEEVRVANATLLVVSNEVGLGLVPDNPIGRAYRDLLGAANRWLAAEADQVLLMVAGLAIDVKRLAEGLP